MKVSVVGLGAASLVAVCCMLAAASSSAAVYGSWGNAQAVPGAAALNTDQVADLTSISCTAAGDCSAGGYYTDASDGSQAFVVDETAGVWGTAQAVPGTAALNAGGAARITSVSCASPGNCGAGGYYTDGAGDSHAFVVGETGGSWGTATEVTGVAGLEGTRGRSAISSVACPSAGDCAAGGNYTTYLSAAGGAFTVGELNGTWGAAHLLPGQGALPGGQYTDINAVSCASAGNCAAAGNAGTEAFVADETSGSWGALREVPGTAGYDDDATSVSCVLAGPCTADGFYTPSSGGLEVPFVVTRTNGTWGKAVPVPVPSTNATAHGVLAVISCVSAGNCAAGGDYAVFSLFTHRAFTVTETNGTWGKAQDVPGIGAATIGYGISEVNSVSCVSPGNCAAGGYFNDSSGRQAFVVDETAGVWGTFIQVNGPGAASGDGSPGIASVSCAAPASCGAAGAYYSNGSQQYSQPLVVRQTPLPATHTALSLAAATVAYGREQAERVSVTVSAVSGTPAGTVTITAGPTPVCTIRLASGEGSCTLPATKFAPGAVLLTASYALSAGFAPSVSAPAGFIVAGAGSKTSLAMSAGTITYGEDQAGQLTVRVAPQFAGTPAGTVTVKAGATTVCAITLRAGAGSCTLSAKKLPPGTYRLTAAYAGSADFKGSASAAKTITVVN
jgi:Bacterial Ig-like domain (group 3)